MYVRIGMMVSLMVSTMAEIPFDMKAKMNTNVHPCDDFYQYACGGWIKSQTLQPGEHYLRPSFDMINKRNRELITTLAKENHAKLGTFWDSCIQSSEVGNTPLQNDLKRIAHATTKETVIALAGEFSRTGTNVFLKFSVQPHPKDHHIYTLYVDAADKTFESDRYREYINELMKMSGFIALDNRKNDDVASTVIQMKEKIHKLETNGKAIKVSLSRAKRRWSNSFGAFLTGTRWIQKSLDLYMDVSYVNQLEEMIISTSVEDLKLYVAYRMVHSRVLWLDESFYNVWYRFFGMDQQRERESICREHLFQYVPDLLGKSFYEKTFDLKQKQYTEEMITLIREAMEHRISNVPWLKKMEKKKTQEKLHHMKILVGHIPSRRMDRLILSRDTYATNVYTILSHSFDVEMNKIGQRVDWNDLSVFSTKPNGKYMDQSNSVILPIAILQSPLLNGPETPARDFGGIGFLIAHELTHGFDQNGIQFDAYGKKLWSQSTSHVYNDRIMCLGRQYSSLKVEGQHGVIGRVSGVLTLNENIADNVGIALAWDAYRNYMTRFDSHEDDKVFFLAFGQQWCSKASDEEIRRRLLMDPHAPNSARVNGVVMNNKDFAKTFHCDAYMRMNPMTKCTIW